MSAAELWPWVALLGLGALHGINPGMGWLFALSLGLQERNGRAIMRALPSLALGHALAVAAALLLALAAGFVLDPVLLKYAVALALVVTGVRRLRKHRHPRVGGMRVNARKLTLWSFLMATGHGAGLMVLPVVLQRGDGAAAHTHHPHAPLAAAADLPHAAGFTLGAEQYAALLSSVVHTMGYLLVTALIAWIVYRHVGLRMLGRYWINIDVIWAAALVATGVLAAVL